MLCSSLKFNPFFSADSKLKGFIYVTKRIKRVRIHQSQWTLRKVENVTDDECSPPADAAAAAAAEDAGEEATGPRILF